MANLTVGTISRAGVALSLAAATGGGDTFTPGTSTFFYLQNGGGGSVTVTFATPGSVISNVTVAQLAVVVTASNNAWIGPFPPQYFADPTDGLVHATYSGVTSVVVGAHNLTQP